MAGIKIKSVNSLVGINAFLMSEPVLPPSKPAPLIYPNATLEPDRGVFKTRVVKKRFKQLDLTHAVLCLYLYLSRSQFPFEKGS